MPNGKSLETAIDANNARAGGLLGLGPTVSYTHSPMFGYNGLTTAPGRRPDASPKIVDQTIVWHNVGHVSRPMCLEYKTFIHLSASFEEGSC
ncbi:hypothetical protein LWI28_005063 [Acer negundo]|uniref:Uncharacterized protein n=1 Tax=Acer negundo TaxID=4023 RepID=A0AAD5J9C9_ACENE|nr:hypothetical protein LWI28_005063 [Acer negundo]